MLEALSYSYNHNLFVMIYICFLVLIFGLVVGSFLNVVGLRLLSGESIVFPPSKCPNCHTRLKWYDNIPVLAYILLLGKCRYCKKPISIQYPIVEAITGLSFLFLFHKFGFSLETVFLWILSAACIVMCITDFKEQIIFDWVAIPMIPLGLIFSFFNIANVSSAPFKLFGLSLSGTFVSALIGMLIAFVFFEVISLLAKIFMNHRAFGEGDTIIAMIFGAWFGWKVLLLTIILGLFVQAVFTIPLLVLKLFKIKDKVALISFGMLLISAIIPVICNRFEIFYSGILSILLVIITFTIAIVSALVFLRRMRELNSYTLLPFGPALIVGGFIAMLYGEYLLNFV